MQKEGHLERLGRYIERNGLRAANEAGRHRAGAADNPSNDYCVTHL